MVEVMIFLVYILLYIFFAFVWGRSVINGYIEYAFKPWEESVIRKNMNWKEWAFFSRFRSVLPKSLLYPYYFFVFFYPLGFAVCFLSLLSSRKDGKKQPATDEKPEQGGKENEKGIRRKSKVVSERLMSCSDILLSGERKIARKSFY